MKDVKFIFFKLNRFWKIYTLFIIVQNGTPSILIMEYFDVLNEKGEKIGITKLRNEVHRDGDWHRTVHIWVFNNNGEVLLQRRSQDKDSNPNKLDISCGGHLSAGDDSISGGIRELKEELGIDATPSDFKFITTIKKSTKYSETYINREFADMFILHTNKTIDELKFQEEEISEIMFVPYNKFKEMVKNKQPDLLLHDEEYEILFQICDKELDNKKC